jgi:hypothetical protein
VEAYQNSNYNTTNIIKKKNLEKTNLTILKRLLTIIMVEWTILTIKDKISHTSMCVCRGGARKKIKGGQIK